MGTRCGVVGCAVLWLAGCSPAEPRPSPIAPAEPEQPSEEPAVPGPRVTLVGVLHEGGTRLCAAPYKDFWVDRTWAVGFVPLVHEPALSGSLAKLEGAVVKASGVATEEPTTVHGEAPPPRMTVRCGEVQMRSDWELWPNGTRARRGDGPDLTKLRIESIEVVEPLRGALREDDVWFAVTNPFDGELKDATLIAHYEGCYGKPGTATERRPLGAIEAGATLEDIPVPQISMRDMARGHEHRLDSVQLIATVDGGALDLDVDIEALGIGVACPKRK